jgi:extracellular elastinolytic metalloproteinase
VHAIGEVWAEMLWVVSQRLIAQHGYVDSLFPPAPLEDGTIPLGDFYRPRVEDPVTGKLGPLVPKHGNSLIVQCVFLFLSSIGQ